MPRISHVLRANCRTVFPTMVIFVDTETDLIPIAEGAVKQKLKFGFAQYRDYSGHSRPDELLFYNKDSFWDWVESHCRDSQKLTILAHNQDFDFRVLEGFSSLAGRGFLLTNIINDQGKFIAEYKKEKEPPPLGEGKRRRIGRKAAYYITILDTLNWFKSSLAQLGKTLGLEKLAMPVDTALSDSWILYCKRDVEILRRAFESYVEFLRSQNMGNFAHTLAKQAMNAYRHAFMRHEVWIHTNPKAVELERNSYYGGRTDCYFIGEIKNQLFYKLDINSQYPFVMRNNRFPSTLMGFRYVIDREYFNSLPSNVTFIALCDVETKTPCIPHRFKNRLCFPVGSFQSALCEPEYRLAEREGAVLKIRSIAYYKSEPLFQEWVDRMYELRNRFKREGNDQYQYFVKLLMNSLYGKFGQRTETWEPIGVIDPSENWVREIVDYDTNKTQTIKALGGTLWEKSGWKEGFDTFVAVASFVTAYARAYLWFLMSQAGLENSYYSDTDSLIVNEQGYERLKPYCDKTRLGFLKLESMDDQLTIHNLKDYSFAGDIVLKGVPKKAAQVGDNSYQCETWEHLAGALRKGHYEEVQVLQTVKHLTRIYEKGTVQPDGRTAPFNLTNGEIHSL